MGTIKPGDWCLVQKGSALHKEDAGSLVKWNTGRVDPGDSSVLVLVQRGKTLHKCQASDLKRDGDDDDLLLVQRGKQLFKQRLGDCMTPGGWHEPPLPAGFPANYQRFERMGGRGDTTLSIIEYSLNGRGDDFKLISSDDHWASSFELKITLAHRERPKSYYSWEGRVFIKTQGPGPNDWHWYSAANLKAAFQKCVFKDPSGDPNFVDQFHLFKGDWYCVGSGLRRASDGVNFTRTVGTRRAHIGEGYPSGLISNGTNKLLGYSSVWYGGAADDSEAIWTTTGSSPVDISASFPSMSRISVSGNNGSWAIAAGGPAKGQTALLLRTDGFVGKLTPSKGWQLKRVILNQSSPCVDWKATSMKSFITGKIPIGVQEWGDKKLIVLYNPTGKMQEYWLEDGTHCSGMDQVYSYNGGQISGIHFSLRYQLSHSANAYCNGTWVTKDFKSYVKPSAPVPAASLHGLASGQIFLDGDTQVMSDSGMIYSGPMI